MKVYSIFILKTESTQNYLKKTVRPILL